MDIIKLTRELGAAIQQDERYLAFTKAREENEKDTELNELMGQIQMVQMNYQLEASKEEPDSAKMQAFEEEFNTAYTKLMDNEKMQAYDAARANWGGTWRLPSEEDFQELIDNCTIAFAYICGTRGFKLTSKINGKYVFLPEAGCDRSGYQEAFFDLGWGNCEYWSSTSKDIYLYTYEDVGVSLSIVQNLSIENWVEEKKAYDNRYVGKLIKIEGGPRWYSRAIRPVSD